VPWSRSLSKTTGDLAVVCAFFRERRTAGGRVQPPWSHVAARPNATEHARFRVLAVVALPCCRWYFAAVALLLLLLFLWSCCWSSGDTAGLLVVLLVLLLVLSALTRSGMCLEYLKGRPATLAAAGLLLWEFAVSRVCINLRYTLHPPLALYVQGLAGMLGAAGCPAAADAARLREPNTGCWCWWCLYDTCYMTSTCACTASTTTGQDPLGLPAGYSHPHHPHPHPHAPLWELSHRSKKSAVKREVLRS
jgi:hypothetical protein